MLIHQADADAAAAMRCCCTSGRMAPTTSQAGLGGCEGPSRTEHTASPKETSLSPLAGKALPRHIWQAALGIRTNTQSNGRVKGGHYGTLATIAMHTSSASTVLENQFFKLQQTFYHQPRTPTLSASLTRRLHLSKYACQQEFLQSTLRAARQLRDASHA